MAGVGDAKGFVLDGETDACVMGKLVGSTILIFKAYLEFAGEDAVRGDMYYMRRGAEIYAV